MRLDLLLVRLRFCKSRTVARCWIEEGHMRCSGHRVTRVQHAIAVGDVLTIPLDRHVQVIEILALPERRGPAAEAQSCYRKLDARASMAIAGTESRPRTAEH
ncbi:S4 domain-containing protein [Aurantiacibacter zhengii]|uniref:RNA-binding S4 domain-containing protein n=1 Tax=Aurantiacibacter zhengii TaxID=2307003 RepID=A0A418NT39_9SPHN|nr:S4 domain-containing protein [Aurantiacibacter zhengii]RIV86568.1 RNA-binding S4 domain-containing protein [Aurantiacibacter zhengii]